MEKIEERLNGGKMKEFIIPYTIYIPESKKECKKYMAANDYTGCRNCFFKGAIFCGEQADILRKRIESGEGTMPLGLSQKKRRGNAYIDDQ